MIRARNIVRLRPGLWLRTLLIALLWVLGSVAVAPDEAGEEVPRFETDIIPIFKANCLACHGKGSAQAGLMLETRESMLQGGDSGPVIKPGTAQESLLFQKVSSGVMPLGGKKLSRSEIDLIRRWIDAGALKEGEDAKEALQRLKTRLVGELDVMMPILYVRCVICHGRRSQEGGLDVRTRASLLKGGKSGPAIVLGKPDESLLIKRIEAEEMPPLKLQRAYAVRPVTSQELEQLRQWIAAGAPGGPDETPEVGSGADPSVSDRDRQFWSFQPPKRPPIPTVQDRTKVRTPIDAFLLEKLEAKGSSFSPEADRLVLMRRAYFDLIGLSPTPAEIEAYLKDDCPGAYERLIDRLLASTHYGERWGQYWLDAAGYADSEGQNNADAVRPHAYRYRDYVIRSLNTDKPYDRFLLEQIAGDELFDYKAVKEPTVEQRDNLVATGFLRMGPDGTNDITQNFIPFRLNVLAEQLDIFSSTVMGLTMGCARCHSHKYDPIPQRDYYRFSAIFQTAYDPYDWLIPNRNVDDAVGDVELPQRLLACVPEQERHEVEAHNAPILQEVKKLELALEEKAQPWRERLFGEKLAKLTLPGELGKDTRRALETPSSQQTPLQKYLAEKFGPSLIVKPEELEASFADYREQAQKIKQAIREAKGKLRPEPAIRALFDMGGEATPAYLLRRAEYLSPVHRVEPGVPSALGNGMAPYRVASPGWKTETSGRRLALGRWLIQPNHPLTARVMVNRIWQHHFEAGLVTTPGNFGKTGTRPSHPELLDWLTTEFVRQGWSLKAVHRLIMISTAYRQSSGFDAGRHAADPDNILLSRFPLRRLDAEAIRNSILKAAERLDPTSFGPPEEVEVRPDGEVISRCSAAGCRRSIYLLRRRSTPITMLQAFDAPQLNPNCLKRSRSTVSSQALQLWNSEMVRENAGHFAARVIDAVGANVEKQVEWVYLTALSRWPTEDEQKSAAAEIQQLTQKWLDHFAQEIPAQPRESTARWQALSTFCHTVFNSAEFMYVD